MFLRDSIPEINVTVVHPVPSEPLPVHRQISHASLKGKSGPKQVNGLVSIKGWVRCNFVDTLLLFRANKVPCCLQEEKSPSKAKRKVWFLSFFVCIFHYFFI